MNFLGMRVGVECRSFFQFSSHLSYNYLWSSQNFRKIHWQMYGKLKLRLHSSLRTVNILEIKFYGNYLTWGFHTNIIFRVSVVLRLKWLEKLFWNQRYKLVGAFLKRLLQNDLQSWCKFVFEFFGGKLCLILCKKKLPGETLCKKKKFPAKSLFDTFIIIKLILTYLINLILL